MNQTEEPENLTTAIINVNNTTTEPEFEVHLCVPGEEAVVYTVPPEILLLQPSAKFISSKTIHQEEVAVKILFYILAILLNVVGNSLVILVVAVSRKMLTTTNMLLVNLAVADLPIGLFCMWVHLGSSITQDWPFGLGVCKVNMFIQVFMISASVLTMMMISIERFFAIVFPLRRSWSFKMVTPIILVIWIISCGIASPQLKVRYLDERRFLDRHVIFCKEKWQEVYRNQQCDKWRPNELVYHLFVGLVMFFIPIIVMVICYTVISVKLLTKKVPGRGSSSGSSSHSKRRVVRMLVLLLVAFVVCWTPAHVLDLIWQLETVKTPTNDSGSYAALYIAYFNSALNPLLYAGFNDNFRRGFRNIIPFWKSRRVGPAISQPRKPRDRSRMPDGALDETRPDHYSPPSSIMSSYSTRHAAPVNQQDTRSVFHIGKTASDYMATTSFNNGDRHH